MKIKRINIIANTIIEPGMSGGNRIFIECAKRWQNKGIKIRILTTDVGRKLCLFNGLSKAEYTTWCLSFRRETVNKLAAFFLYLLGTVIGGINTLKLNLDSQIVYSSSDYWPDSVPAFLAKFKNPKLKWVAGFYLFAPKPWQKDSPYQGKAILIGWLFWLTQLPVYWLVKRYADMIFVTSEPDVGKFVTKKRDKNKIVVVRGGVDLEKTNQVPEPKNKKYDAVFIGRFHPQKGVLELIDIWKRVIKKKPQARLAMIGDGPLIRNVKLKIKNKKLEKNIHLLGFLDGIPKIKILKSAKIVVHPAIYDSGGMGSAEAMVAGLPGVSFDLKALRSYYPKGMLKVKKFKLDEFAGKIIELLDDKKLYQKMKTEALAWAKGWDWDKRANYLLKKIKILTS